MAITVFVADDDPLVLMAYEAFFGRRDDIDLIGTAPNGRAAVEAYERLRPDVVLMDLQMPVMTGTQAIGEIYSRWPSARVVAITTFGSIEQILGALRAGAAGYLTKDVGGPGLVDAIHSAMAGEMPLSPAVRRELVAASVSEPPAPDAPKGLLTAREIELLEFLAQGYSNKQIGDSMFISEGSVKQYLSRIGEKLNVSSRIQVLVRAIQLGVIDPRRLPPVQV